MDTQLPGVRHLLTLVLVCLLSVACRQSARPATPAPPAAAPVPRNNLLRNPGFEAGVSSWEPSSGPASPVLSLDPAGFVSVAVATAGSPQYAAWSQAVPVQAGAAYYVAYRAQTEGLAGCAALSLAFQDAAGRLLEAMDVRPVSGDTDWATYAWRCRAPAGAAQALLSVGVKGASAGRAAFDDVCFAPDDAPVTRALIVDWREAAGELAVPAGLTGDSPRDLAWALASAQAEPMACPGGAATQAGEPLVPGVLARLSETPQRLATQGGDALGFTLLAGRSEDGCLAQILIADAGSRSEAYRLALAGFPPGFCYSVAEVGAGGQLRLLREGDSSGLNGLLMSPWRSPAVHLIRIWWP